MNQLSYYVTKRLIVGSKDSSGTIIHIAEQLNENKSTKQSNKLMKSNNFLFDGMVFVDCCWLCEWSCEAKWSGEAGQAARNGILFERMEWSWCAAAAALALITRKQQSSSINQAKFNLLVFLAFLSYCWNDLKLYYNSTVTIYKI